MAGAAKPPVLVVLQLSGGNDFLNTVIPFENGVYHDSRPTVRVSEDELLPIDSTLAFHPRLSRFNDLYNRGMVAVIQGIGYPNHNRSHFRGMDIWHTCEPEQVATEGWLGRAIRDLDPRHENVLTGISFGRGLPRAMAAPDVPVTSVGDLDSYGLLSGIKAQEQRDEALGIFREMYTPAVGAGIVTDYLTHTGTDVLSGADLLKQAPERYQSGVQYADNPLAKSLRDVARVHLAGLGTRVFYTQHGGYDTHATQLATHPRLLDELSGAIADFYQDLEEHGAAGDVVMLVFTEFGRRIKDNGSGTDHGSGGGAYLIGRPVRGGLYGEYPSLDLARQLNGEDLSHNIDFRGVYATVLEQWLDIDAGPIVGGSYEQVRPFVAGAGAA